jgi:hypothetical protein
MTLDLTKIASALDDLADETKNRSSANSMIELADAYAAVDSRELIGRLQTAKTSWLLARPASSFQATIPSPAPASDYTVVASDGSFILPDRHSPARFYVINIGKVVLRYGSEPSAEIEAEPKMYFREEELYVPDEVRRIPVNGAVLGFKRAAEELESVARVAVEQPAPAIALQDGTLILWGLESQAEPVMSWVLDQYLGALDILRQHEVPVASYISYPASSDVVHSIRVSVCDYPDAGRPVNCDHCHARVLREQHTPACDVIPDVNDRLLFEQVARLAPGERSQVFESSSKILDRYGEDHRVHFFYLHSGTEVGRVEIPHWVARDRAKLDLVQATIFEQCTLGRGYPSALQEAHEIAAIRPDERMAIELLVEQALANHGLVYRRSGKAESKRGRFV